MKIPGDGAMSPPQESAPKPKLLTPEILLADRELLGKLYKKLTSSSNGSIYGEVDFGPEYGKVECNDLYFQLGYYLGVFISGSSSLDPLVKYIKLAYEDRDSANAHLETIREKISKEAFDYIERGRDLSGIIPGAAPAILGRHKFATLSPGVSSRDTSKVGDLLSLDRQGDSGHRKTLEDLVRGKTVVDFGGGSYAEGLRLASILAARNYVGVEPYNREDLLSTLSSDVGRGDFMSDQVERQSFGREETLHKVEKVNISATDIKTFLENLPESLEDIVYIISGIDEFVMGVVAMSPKDKPAVEERERYIADVNRLLATVLSRTKNGVLITYASIFAPEGDTDFVMDEIQASETPVRIFRKAKS